MKFVRGRGTAQNTQGEASSQDDRDVFTKSEKWLPPLPKCEHGTWKTREQEILGFAGYVQSLRSSVALASDTFGWEVETCCFAFGTGQDQIGFGRQLGCLGGRFQVCDCYAQPPWQDLEHRKDWKGIAQEHI